MNHEDKLPDFTGKIVTFYLSAASSNWLIEGALLQPPIFERQGGRMFITGRTLDNSNDDTK